MEKCRMEEFKEAEEAIKMHAKKMRSILDDVVDDIDGLIIDIREDRVTDLDDLELRLIDIRDSILS